MSGTAEQPGQGHGPRYLSRTVPPDLAGSTVKHFLKVRFSMAEGYIAALKLRPDGIRVEGRLAFTDRRLLAGETVTVRIDDGEKRNDAEPVSLSLELYYEDADLAVLEKPAGLAVPGVPGGPPTLVNAMAARWEGRPFHPVHRLDRGTSGLLLAAKSAYVSELLRRSLHTEGFVREYLALVHGLPEPAGGEIDLPIGPGEGGLRRVCLEGQSARTSYRMLFPFPGGSVLRLRLFTGRTHQIRVHLSALGHPLLGDIRYGAPPEPGLRRPALHAAFLRLTQPVTGEALEFASPLPEDLTAVLGKRACLGQLAAGEELLRQCAST